MATKKKISQRAPSSNTLEEALDALESLKHVVKANGDARLERAFKRLWVALEPLLEADEAATGDDLSRAYARSAAGLAPQAFETPNAVKTGRHDRTRKQDGPRTRSNVHITIPGPRPSADLRSVVDSLLLTMACWVYVPTKAGMEQLFHQLQRMLRGARHGTALVEHEQEIRTAYEAIFGYPYGERWRQHLEVALRNDAHARVRKRLQGAPIASDRLFLKRLRDRVDGKLPPELTLDVISELRKSTNLGGGGRHGGKSPKGTVAGFVKTISRLRKKPNSKP